MGFVQALNQSDPAQLADVLAQWSQDSGGPQARIQAAAERLVARHGGGRMVLRAIVGDFLPLMRDEGLTMPPDLLLIFKALMTIDGVLSGIQPDFDLSDAMRRASLRIVQARLSPDHWGPTVQALMWELGRIGDDAPRLLRALVRRMEAEPTPAAPATADTGARWIAAAILSGAALIAAAQWWG